MDAFRFPTPSTFDFPTLSLSLSLSLSHSEMASTTSSSFAFSKFDSLIPNPQYRRKTGFPYHFRRTHLPKIVPPKKAPFSTLNLDGYHSISCLASSLMDPSEEKSLSDLKPTTQSPEVEVRSATWNWRGYRIRYQFAGNSGPALLLVHGFGANSDHWRKNLTFLARSHKVYSIDLIGYGYSDKPNPRDFGTNSFYTFETWGTQLNDFCVDVVKSEAFFICNSIGGLVGLQAAIMQPEICKGIILLNISLRMLHIKKQPWYGRPFIKSFQNLLRNTAVGKFFYKAVATPKSVRSILCQCYHDTSKVTDELVEKILLPGLEPGAADIFLDFICYSDGPLPEELLPQVKCPVLVGWGDKDPWEPIELGKAYGDFDSVEDFIILPNVGHCPQDEAPELVNPLVESFVARNTTRKVNADPLAI